MLRRRSSSCWLGLSSVLVLGWFPGRTTILSAPDAKPSSSCWLGLSSVLVLGWFPGRTSAPDVKPPPAVLLSVLGRDLPLPGPASVLMNSIPIVTQLDIFEPRQETERCRRGGLELRLRNLRGVHPRIIRGWRAGLEATPCRTLAREAESMASRVMTRAMSQDHDPPHSLCLLRARRERPRGCSTAEQRDERAAHHSITSSARANSVAGSSRPRALAVLRLTTSSYLVGA